MQKPERGQSPYTNLQACHRSGYPTAFSLEIISQISQSFNSVFLSKKKSVRSARFQPKQTGCKIMVVTYRALQIHVRHTVKTA
jgi:hypothetical protein